MAGLLAIGECMMELTPQVSSQGQSGYNRAFAGDTYNALVYAKRSVSDIDAYFFTAIGTDDISNVMSSTWRQEGINPSFALPLNHATIGLYAISTDDSGERSFSYWRKDSAATQMMTVKPVDELIKACPKVNCVFFSGISLGILSEDDKALLINFVKGLRMQGVKVAFDPNYRPAMWADINHAIFWLEQAYSNSDIVLPGEEDHQALFQHQGHEAIANYCEKLGVNESVIKCGEQGTFVYQQGQKSSAGFEFYQQIATKFIESKGLPELLINQINQSDALSFFTPALKLDDNFTKTNQQQRKVYNNKSAAISY